MESPEQAVERITSERDALAEQVKMLRSFMASKEAGPEVDAVVASCNAAREALNLFTTKLRQHPAQDATSAFTVASELSEEYRKKAQQARK